MKTYQSPLSTRYASPEMSYLFSPDFKYSTWRKLWVALAEAQSELGLPITKEQIQEMVSCVNKIDYDAAARFEKELKHDVMAHIHAFGQQCPEAKPILHLGATSCFVTDNTDIIQMRDGLKLLLSKVVQAAKNLATFAKKNADLPCLGFTHFQPAQLTTVGKRACLWLQDFMMDIKEIESRINNLKFLGAKGATGTQASFLALLNGNVDQVAELDKKVARKMGFEELYTISGQTYTRKQDIQIFSALSSLAASAHKFATDLRLLTHLKEVMEPFEKKQVGSTAMPYKRNPILAERICGLSRFVISLSENGPYTAATQWLERSLDDSANRRLVIPEIFLGADAVLNLLIHITSQLSVNQKAIEKHVAEELPNMATENILMAAVKKGKDRQHLHEKIRVYSQSDDILASIASDSDFGLSKEELNTMLNVKQFVGLAPQQTQLFLEREVEPLLNKYDSSSVKVNVEI